MSWIKITQVTGGTHAYIRVKDVEFIAPSNEGTKICCTGMGEGEFFHARESTADIFDQITGRVNKIPTEIPADASELPKLSTSVRAALQVEVVKNLRQSLKKITDNTHFHLASGFEVLEKLYEMLDQTLDALQKQCDSYK